MRASRALRAIGATSLAALIVLTGTAAPADESPAPETPAIGATLTYASPAIATAATPVTMTATVTNAGLDNQSAVTGELVLTTAPLTTDDELDAWLAGEESPTREVATSTPRARQVPALGSAEMTATVQAGRLGLPPTAWGVWGIEFRVVVDGEVARTMRSALTWRGAQASPSSVPLAVVATVAGSPERARALATAATGVTGVDVAIDPTALPLDDTLDAPAYLLPAGHLDIVSISRAEQPRLLDEALGRAGMGATDAPPWLAVLAEPDGAALSLVSRRGASAVIVEPAYGWEEYASLAPISRFQSDLPVFAPDADLSYLIAHASPTDPTSRAVVTAYGTLAAQRGGPVIVSTGPSWVVNGDQRSPVLAALTSSPWLTATPLAELAADADLPEVASSSPGQSTGDIAPSTIFRVSQAVSSITALAAAVEGDEPIGATSVPTLLRSLSTEGRLDPERRTTTIASALETADGVRASVGISEGSALNLFTSEGNVPLSIYNDLGVPVTVRVVMDSRSPNLVVKGSPQVTVEPGSERQVHVPVEAVSSANVTVSLYLENSDGAQIAQRSDLSMRVRAEWGEGFTIAVAVLAGALFAAGVFRTLQRGRGDTRIDATEPADL